jgi:hypothetical protein
MGRVYSTNREMNANRILVGRQEGKRRILRQRHRWVDNIEMDLG